MKIPFKSEQEGGFRCKECSMSFSSKEALDRHKKKARHYSGRIYFGSHDK